MPRKKADEAINEDLKKLRENEPTIEPNPFDLAIPDQVKRILFKPVPKDMIRKRPGRGGLDLSYVSIGYVVNTLNEAFGGYWSFNCEPVAPEFSKLKNLIVKGTLTVYLPGFNAPLVKEQFGSAEIKIYRQPNPNAGSPIDIGDDFKAAASDALKKCASLLGVAKELYFSDMDFAEGFKSNGHEKEPAEKKEEKPEEQEPSVVVDRPITAAGLSKRMKAMKLDRDQMAKILADMAGKDSFYKLTDDDIKNISVYLDALESK